MKTLSVRQVGFSNDFLLVAAGQVISIFGNQIVRYALPLYLLNQTGSAVLFGSILAVSFIPMLLIYPVGGIIADRLNKRNIMVVLDFGTAVFLLLFCLLEGWMNIVPLMAVTLIGLYAIQGAYQPAVQASVPLLVDADHIMQGNSIINTITSLASMLGPVIGGILFSMTGLASILYVSIGCFLISAVMEMFIRIPYVKRQVNGTIFRTSICDLKESFVFMFKEQPVLWKASFIYTSAGFFLTALVLIAVPVLITQHLGFATETANRLYGYAQGVMATGAIAGGIIAGLFSKKLRPRTSPFILVGSALSVMAGGAALQFLRGSMEIYIVLVAGCGILTALSTLFQIQIMSNIQLLTPKSLTGKVISCVICICMCTLPPGQFIYGFIFEKMSGYFYLPFYVAGVAVIVISFFTRGIFRHMDTIIKTDC